MLTAAQVRVALVWVAMLAPLAGEPLTAQEGTGGTGITGITMAAVVKLVVLLVAQLFAAPVAFLGAINQLYKVEAVNPVAL